MDQRNTVGGAVGGVSGAGAGVEQGDRPRVLGAPALASMLDDPAPADHRARRRPRLGAGGQYCTDWPFPQSEGISRSGERVQAVGLAGHANTNAELVDAARAQIAELQRAKSSGGSQRVVTVRQNS